MTGIYGAFAERKLDDRPKLSSLFSREIQHNHLVDSESFHNADLFKSSLRKFENDKIFRKTGDLTVATEGFVLNVKDLLRKEGVKDLYPLILKLHREHDGYFLEELRGSFAGFIYSEKENKLLLYNDQIGSRPLFYFYDRSNGSMIFGSELGKIVNMMRVFGNHPHLDTNGAYCLLTFGHMLGDLTLVKEIKRVPPGSILAYDGENLSIKQYYQLSNKPYVSESEENILHELARRFRTAVLQEYAKDLEYGYSHIMSLSGGLDSRTNVAFAKKLGMNNITCFTCSQSNYLDYKISRKISRDNQFNYIFHSLNGGNHLIKYIDEIINTNGGLMYYAGICNLYASLKRLDLDRYGLLHTGLLGGEIFGEYIPYSHRATRESLRYFIRGQSSGSLLGRISHLIDREFSKYESPELFKFYNVGVNAQFTNLHSINQLTDAVSAHLYLDLVSYVLRIPAHLRANKRLYAKMVSMYLPDFAKYTWEHYRIPPRYPLFSLTIYEFALNLINRGISKLMPYYNMSPFEYWYKENSALRNGFESAFNDNIGLLNNHDNLKDECTIVFREGNFYERAAVLTLLKAVSSLGMM